MANPTYAEAYNNLGLSLSLSLPNTHLCPHAPLWEKKGLHCKLWWVCFWDVCQLLMQVSYILIVLWRFAYFKFDSCNIWKQNSPPKKGLNTVFFSFKYHFVILCVGVLYRDAGNISMAISAYEQCLEIDPDSRNAGQVLSFFWLPQVNAKCLWVPSDVINVNNVTPYVCTGTPPPPLPFFFLTGPMTWIDNLV